MMKSYIWLTFGFLGWAFYELSGGADFEPEQRVVAEAAPVQAPEIVTRAETTTLLSLSTSNVAPQPMPSEVEVIEASVQAAELDAVEADTEVIEVTAPPVETVADIRRVAGNRVNMRIGPGTGFDVITTLDGGTELEVLSVNDDGWANVSVLNTGYEGWMAERFLTDPET